MGLWETSKDVLEAIRKVASIEDQQKLIDLQAGILQMQEQDAALKKENQELREKLATAGSLTHRRNCYWRDDHNDPGPFCARCWDADKLLIHLRTTGDPHLLACDNCEKGIRTD